MNGFSVCHRLKTVYRQQGYVEIKKETTEQILHCLIPPCFTFSTKNVNKDVDVIATTLKRSRRCFKYIVSNYDRLVEAFDNLSINYASVLNWDLLLKNALD